ncbi:MAG TPA: VOC family protein, partial [Bryobacteraceae bacterium]|nr:VOC family protein [Bryobacteraceae bacterium]
FDVMDAGRMAVVQDPTGAIFQLWQAKRNPGIGIAGVEGTLCWADLSTGDPPRAKQFYEGLFGWNLATGENDPSGYLHIRNGQDFIGGVPSTANRAPNAPACWMVYFFVNDVDASTAKVAALGGKVVMPAMTMEGVGRFSVVCDPQGATFLLFGTPPKR